MLFASTELAARIERAECEMLTQCAAAAQRRDARAFARAIAGGVATFGGPGSPLNKLAGLGLAGPVDEAELADVEQAFAERTTPRAILVRPRAVS